MYPNDVNAKIIYSVSATNATKTIPNIQNESLSKSPPVIVIVADPVGLLANTKSLLNGDFDPNIKASDINSNSVEQNCRNNFVYIKKRFT